MVDGESRRDGKVIIRGGKRLHGRVAIPGTKHGSVMAFAATVAAAGKLVLDNVPLLTDRFVLSDIIRSLGGDVHSSGSRVVIRGSVSSAELPPSLTQRVHGSVYLLPAVLAQHGSVIFSGAGGDGFGNFDHGLSRPIQHMLEIAAEFGAQWRWLSNTTVRLSAERLRPTKLNLLRWSTNQRLPEGPYVSGASKTALLLAAAAEGTSVILHPHAREAQHELILVLRRLGIDIEQRDACWIVRGGTFSSSADYRLMPCPVEFATWQTISCVTDSELFAEFDGVAQLISAVHRELDFLSDLGIEPQFCKEGAHLRPAAQPYNGRNLVAEATGISTDITPLLSLILNGATSSSEIRDRVWGERFGYAEELNRLGARMSVRDGRLIVIPSGLRSSPHPLRPADTRAAAVCVAAALAVEGETSVHGLPHLERGYGRLADRLRLLGADLRVEAH
jgi:UDP-N-acetylglucosamine 1-carboxyvinyltransferase